MSADIAHSRFGASSAHRWMRCAGSVVLNDRIPAPPSSIYAQEGTHAHALLAHCLKEGTDALSYVDKPFVDAPDRQYDADMCEAVQVALDWIDSVREEFPDAQGWSERSFVLPTMNAAGEVYGTSDVVVYVPSTLTLYVPDFKFGYGVVDPDDNEQLLHYGLGAMFALEVPVRDLVVGIIQPRAIGVAPIRWAADTSSIRALDFLAELETAIERAQAAEAAFPADASVRQLPQWWADAYLSPGPDQCQWCAAGSSGICPAREQRALAITQQAFTNVRQVTEHALPKPETIPLDRVGYILEHGKFIEQWLADVQTFARSEALAGRHVPGFKLVDAQGRRKWEGDPAVIAAKLVEISGLPESEFYEPKLKGIINVEKKITRAAVDALRDLEEKPDKAARDAATTKAKNAMAFLTLKQGSGALSLVPENDPRPAVNPATVNFKGVIT